MSHTPHMVYRLKYLARLFFVSGGMGVVACSPSDYMAGPPDTDTVVHLTAESGGWTAIYVTGLAELNHSGDVSAGNPALCPARYNHPVILAVGQTVELRVTSSESLTGLCVPAMGLNIDAIPGRLNSAYVKPLQTGEFCGTCLTPDGELDKNSTIVVKVVSPTAYKNAVPRALSEK